MRLGEYPLHLHLFVVPIQRFEGSTDNLRSDIVVSTKWHFSTAEKATLKMIQLKAFASVLEHV